MATEHLEKVQCKFLHVYAFEIYAFLKFLEILLTRNFKNTKNEAPKKSMIENKGGVIVNIGSSSWMVGQGGMAAYTAAKSGVVGLTRSFARDLGEFNIRVNSVVPGWVLTKRQIDLWLNEESEKDLMKNQCLKERLLPHELAQAVLFF